MKWESGKAFRAHIALPNLVENLFTFEKLLTRTFYSKSEKQYL